MATVEEQLQQLTSQFQQLPPSVARGVLGLCSRGTECNRHCVPSDREGTRGATSEEHRSSGAASGHARHRYE
eukprot:10780423-Prorocentrum_lima.AAC.1